MNNIMNTDSLIIFQKNLIRFYLLEGRIYPWRIDRNPFKVYISEILLQRTRADQVVPVYQQLIEKFPDTISLFADFNRAIPIMYPLGRSIRLDYFQKGLRYINEYYNGQIPFERKDLLSVPGIGPYIESAIRLFGYNIRDTIIDTNVIRVVGRFNGIEIHPEIRRKKSFISIARNSVPEEKYVEYSYGLLDFAEKICKSRNPDCNNCKLATECLWNLQKRTNKI